MTKILNDPAQCADAAGLASALRALCAEFGPVSRFDVLTMIDSGRRKAVCLMQLESYEREQELMAKLGANRFGEDLCVVFDLGMPARAESVDGSCTQHFSGRAADVTTTHV